MVQLLGAASGGALEVSSELGDTGDGLRRGGIGPDAFGADGFLVEAALGWVVALRLSGGGSVVGGLWDRLVDLEWRLIHCGNGWIVVRLGERCDDVAWCGMRIGVAEGRWSSGRPYCASRASMLATKLMCICSSSLSKC